MCMPYVGKITHLRAIISIPSLLPPRQENTFIVPSLVVATSAISANDENTGSFLPILISKAKSLLASMLRSLLDRLKMFLRLTEISLALSPLVLLIPLCPTSNLTARYIRGSFRYLGPTFVKLGQWLSTRRDLLPGNFTDVLGDLCSRNEPRGKNESLGQVRERVEGLLIDGSEVLVEDDVVGVGCIASVYRARINDKNVVVKVRSESALQSINRDLRLLGSLTSAVYSLPLLPKGFEYFALRDAVEEFSGLMERQLDLRVEGDNLRRWGENFEGWKEVINFPRVLHADEDIIIEEFMEGVSIEEFMTVSEGGVGDNKVGKELAGPLLRAFLKMVFTDNFIHADLHPGNILVRQEGSVRQICIVDGGLIVELLDTDRKNLRELFKAVVTNQGELAGRLMVERAKFEVCSQRVGGVEKFSEEGKSGCLRWRQTCLKL